MFRDIVIFLAGALALHTISHISLAYAVDLPLSTKYGILTPVLNLWTIVFSGFLTVALICLAARLKRS
jgi:hypothetical protein